MKRDIKFRGKRIDNGEWVYGSYTQMREDDHNECFRAKPHKVYHRIWQWEAGDWNMGGYANYEVVPETVGQFTGLKDKNGVEIYEGDIVIEKSYPMYDNSLCNYRCVVVWDEEKAGFGLEMYVVSNRVRGCAVPDSISEYTELEVIGNIHDNLELIANLE